MQLTIKIRHSAEDDCFIASIGESDIAHGETAEEALKSICEYLVAIEGKVDFEHLANQG